MDKKEKRRFDLEQEMEDMLRETWAHEYFDTLVPLRIFDLIFKLGFIDPSSLATRKVKIPCGDCGGSGRKLYFKGKSCAGCPDETAATCPPNIKKYRDGGYTICYFYCTPCHGTGSIEKQVPVMKKCEGLCDSCSIFTVCTEASLKSTNAVCTAAKHDVQATWAEVMAAGLESDKFSVEV